MSQRKICGVHGVVIIANDFQGQVEFYRDVMGFKVLEQYPDAVFFEVGEQKLGIFSKGHHPEGDKNLGGADHGISHLEFMIKQCDVDSMHEHLDSSGAHAYRDNYKDADGNLFHFVIPEN